MRGKREKKNAGWYYSRSPLLSPFSFSYAGLVRLSILIRPEAGGQEVELYAFANFTNNCAVRGFS